MIHESMTLYHGSRQLVTEPEIRLARYHKDFFFGFYCTKYEEQAIRWATRFGGTGFLNEFLFTLDSSLKVLEFPQMTEEWLDFIVACRSGIPHDFDVVEGPMANDTIFNYIQDFISGKISRSAFWELARFSRPTHQVSFHTVRALTTLKFVRGSEVSSAE